MSRKSSELVDVENFLSAFVDCAVDQGVMLITNRMSDCGMHCLLGELLARDGWLLNNDDDLVGEELGRRLGISSIEVGNIMEGWDWASCPRTTLMYESLGRRLRARYLSRRESKMEVST